MLLHKDKPSRRQSYLENVLCFYFISKSSSRAYIIILPGSDSFLFVYCNPSFISVLFVRLTSLWIKTLSKLFKQTPSWEHLYQRWFMERSIEFARCVIKNCVTVWLRVAAERSDLAYYKLCNIKTSVKNLVNFYLVGS